MVNLLRWAYIGWRYASIWIPLGIDIHRILQEEPRGWLSAYQIERAHRALDIALAPRKLYETKPKPQTHD